ncbi:MAG: ABC transporter permease [Thermoanaerobacterales bacterium]|nr:ABC transporter permease [Bacillota bacterium]MDI6906182.1 ABC transporter permease [Thermoanaerobacterales bacterium]
MLRRLLTQLAGVAVLIILWHLAATALGKPVLPTPLVAMEAFARDLPRELGGHFLISLARVAVSIAVSFFLAVPLGLFLGREERLDRFIAPLIYVIYPIPVIVFLPVIMTFFGVGNFSKVLLIVIVVFFQLLVTTRDAAGQVNSAVIDSVRSLGARTPDIYRHVIWPAALPKIFTALRIGSGTAIAVLFIAETIASQEGLGYYLLDAWTQWHYPELYAGIIAMGLMGFAVYTVIDFADRRFCPWEHL